jgi:hypothetical protein
MFLLLIAALVIFAFVVYDFARFKPGILLQPATRRSCATCGQEVEDGWKVCPRCGQIL